MITLTLQHLQFPNLKAEKFLEEELKLAKQTQIAKILYKAILF
jgi:hypothetical protein